MYKIFDAIGFSVVILAVGGAATILVANATPWNNSKEVTPIILQERFHNLEVRVQALEEYIFMLKPEPKFHPHAEIPNSDTFNFSPATLKND